MLVFVVMTACLHSPVCVVFFVHILFVLFVCCVVFLLAVLHIDPDPYKIKAFKIHILMQIPVQYSRIDYFRQSFRSLMKQ